MNLILHYLMNLLHHYQTNEQLRVLLKLQLLVQWSERLIPTSIVAMLDLLIIILVRSCCSRQFLHPHINTLWSAYTFWLHSYPRFTILCSMCRYTSTNRVLENPEKNWKKTLVQYQSTCLYWTIDVQSVSLNLPWSMYRWTLERVPWQNSKK